MKHLPLFFDMAGRKVVVVGSGPIADRKAATVRSAGADVRQVATAERADFDGAVAAFVATGTEAGDRAAHAMAKAAGVAVNVADRPALCDFILPAIVDRGDVVVAVSTGGASPTLATVLRGRIEAALPERIGALAELARTFRKQANALISQPAERRAFWRRQARRSGLSACYWLAAAARSGQWAATPAADRREFDYCLAQATWHARDAWRRALCAQAAQEPMAVAEKLAAAAVRRAAGGE